MNSEDMADGIRGRLNPFTTQPVPESAADRIPPRIANHTMLARIGGGSYGDVWLARSTTGQLRAVKVVWRQHSHGMLFEPGQQEAYLFNGRGQSATVMDVKSGKPVATIPLPRKPEFAAADPKAGRVYNNIEDKNVLVAIDTQPHQVVNTWPIAPGEEASGMAIDLAHHRLFIGCRNKLMAMIDSTNGKAHTRTREAYLLVTSL